ncbi:morphogenetic protein [Pantoea ananatis]
MRDRSGTWQDYKHEQFLAKCPFGAVGDRLWVRETWQGPLVDYDEAYSMFKDPTPYQKAENCVHRADGGPCPEFTDADDNLRQGWRPSIHMPRWASRITLEITGVRVERLQDISKANAKAEGLAEITKDGSLFKFGIPDRDGYPGTDDKGWPWAEWERNPVQAYRKLWQSIYGEESWQANPWVWVIEFKRLDNADKAG